ncbi:MAG: MBL fold metallo-hydrolase, partial [Gammaproteobacteria bacterium]|nr:MBL fold metallo-hydrolase [Gammaproteobacteria bacterium]
RTLSAIAIFIFVSSVFSVTEVRAQALTADALAASDAAQQHIAAARALAGEDLAREAEALCSAEGTGRAVLVREAAGLPLIEDHVVAPTQMFENLYFIGFNDVGAWAIDTSNGLILIDTLNSPDEARDVLVPGLERMGLDPNRIEYVIIGHGHNDHVGGASYLQETYGARILMSAADWDLALSGERPDRPRPMRDVVISDGQQVTLGDTTVTVAITPGHTAGTLTMFVPVEHLGQAHTAVIFSGTQMPSADAVANFKRVFDEIAQPLNTEAVLGGHPGVADLDPEQLARCRAAGGPCWTSALNTLEIHAQLREAYPDGPHPLLLGQERFDRYTSIMLECASAKLAVMQ